MPFCCVLIVGAYTTTNPSAVGADHFVSTHNQPRGVFRVTRHPALWAVGLWATPHFLASGEYRAMVLFGTMAFLAFAGTIHMDIRKLKEKGEDWASYLSRTSNIPFLAISQGKQAFQWREIGLWRFVAAILLYIGMLVFHEMVTGMSPLPMPSDT